MSEEHSLLTAGVEPGLSERVDELLFRFQAWQYRGWVAALAAGLVVSMVGLGWWFSPVESTVDTEASIPFAVGDSADGDTNAQLPSGGSDTTTTVVVEPPVVVHVRGEVVEPGLVELPAGSRVDDAVAGAGGPTGQADIHQLNLAAVLGDGVQIIVPAIGEEVTGPLIRHPEGGSGVGQEGLAVNVNTASQAELEALPGIGPAIAAAIDQRRNDEGPFRSVDELLEVTGIGPAKLEGIADLVTV